MKKNIKKYIPWIILLLVILSLSTWYILSRRVTQEQLSIYQTKIEEAQTHVQARQYTTALTKYYDAVDVIPSKIEAYEGIIDILILKNRLDNALEVLEKSARPLSSNDKSVLYMKIGNIHYNLGEYEKALSIYDDGMILGVTNRALELMIGKTYLNMGDIKKAQAQLLNSGYEGIQKEEANLLLAYTYALENKDKAKTTLNSVDPSEEMAIYYEEFSDVLESLDEDEKFNATKLSRVYINNGYPYLAIQILEPLEDEIVEYLEGMYFLGRAYYEYGQYDKAIYALDSALTLGGMEMELLWIKGRAYLEKDDLDNTLRNYDGAIGYSGSNYSEELVSEYIDMLLENNQNIKASEVIKTILSVNEDVPSLYLEAIKVYSAIGEEEKISYYISLLEDMELTDQEEKEYLQWKITILLEEDEDIDEYMTQLLELDAFNPNYQYILAKDQLREGDEQLAIQSLEKALEYDLEYEITQNALSLLSSLR